MKHGVGDGVSRRRLTGNHTMLPRTAASHSGNNTTQEGGDARLWRCPATNAKRAHHNGWSMSHGPCDMTMSPLTREDAESRGLAG